MKAIVLAAGYATRLPRHLRKTPKALLPIVVERERRVVDRPLIEFILSHISAVDEIDHVFIVTNNRYLAEFERWHARFGAFVKPIRIVPNGTTSEHERRGALGDLRFIVDAENIDGNVLVIAGDNFFEFSLPRFVDEFRHRVAPMIALCDMGDPDKVRRRFGVASLADDGRIKQFEEKPERPATALASTLCYILTQRELDELRRYLDAGRNADEAGRFVTYLVESGYAIYGHRFSERWVDIGDEEQYRALRQAELTKLLSAGEHFSYPMDAVILFADVIDSATISEYSAPEEYDRLIAEFQTIALRVIQHQLAEFPVNDRAFCEYSVRGDEAVLIMYTGAPERDAATALAVAIELKRQCFLSRFNRARRGRSFYDIAIGVHFGTVMVRHHPSARDSGRTFNAEGYSINLTKRIEGYARNGSVSKIMLSKRLTDIFIVPVILSQRIDVSLTGIYGAFPVYELHVYGKIDEPQQAETVALDDIDYYVAALESSGYDMWLSLIVARHFYDEEDYVTADKYYRSAIERLPTFAAGYTYRGRNFYRQNKFREAREMLEKACELEPLSSKAHNFLAVTLRRLGEYDLALEHHERATKFEPQSPYEYNAFAYTIAEAWRSKAGRDRYDLAKATAYLVRAEGLFAERRSEYAYVLEHTRGVIHLADGGRREAVGCFWTVVNSIDGQPQMMPRKREEKRLEAIYHLGVAHHEMDRPFHTAARGFFKKSLESPEIQAEERVPYYWFSDARERIRIIELGIGEPPSLGGERCAAPCCAGMYPLKW